MSISGVFFTNKGLALQAKAQTGTPLHFTRIAIGDGELQGQAPQTFNKLVSEKLSIEITKLTTGEYGTAKVGGSFNNSNLETGFYYRELGLFARDPDNMEQEILYCYGNAGALADYIPAQGSELIEKKIDIIAIIGNATKVSATINSSLVSLSPEDLEMHDKDPEAHKPIRDWVQSLFDSVKHTWDGITGKPDTFPPSKHNHSKSEITDFEHNHDERYYTETESDERFAAKNHGTHVSYGTDTTGSTYGGTAAAGSATTVSRSDHKHALPALPVGSVNTQGIVQLNNTVTSTSTTEAGTAHAVKMAYDKGVEAYEYASRSVIKSVQKGSVVMGQNNHGYARITISPIDVNKAFLLVDSNPAFSMTNVSLAVGQILSPTLIEIQQGTTGGTYSNSAYWQVIEFY